MRHSFSHKEGINTDLCLFCAAILRYVNYIYEEYADNEV